ncbi:hypothetical protein EJ06DRAFT_198595 [Trichodelitschia bisporula]|uniref:Uncharacterized protein n=1 Tax=Trichodelitschia bisporula TaxID=703511 RepID=A0A6G1I7W0_9PEZI|nr:hypothetical protein EJ06DRAFT_198595 [Trichodelitschia bisporula]
MHICHYCLQAPPPSPPCSPPVLQPVPPCNLWTAPMTERGRRRCAGVGICRLRPILHHTHHTPPICSLQVVPVRPCFLNSPSLPAPPHMHHLLPLAACLKQASLLHPDPSVGQGSSLEWLFGNHCPMLSIMCFPPPIRGRWSRQTNISFFLRTKRLLLRRPKQEHVWGRMGALLGSLRKSHHTPVQSLNTASQKRRGKRCGGYRKVTSGPCRLPSLYSVCFYRTPHSCASCGPFHFPCHSPHSSISGPPLSKFPGQPEKTALDCPKRRQLKTGTDREARGTKAATTYSAQV